MRLRFGIFPSPAVEALEETMTAVEVADRAGLDLIGIQDHPYVDRFLDVMTLITWLAAATDTITSSARLPSARTRSRAAGMCMRMLVCIAGFVLLFIALVFLRTQTEIRARRTRALLARERMG